MHERVLPMQPRADLDRFKPVLHSKSSDEILVNFARWEPWHGKFGFFYPWNKYLSIGESLRELAASVLLLRGCLRSRRQETARKKISGAMKCVRRIAIYSWNSYLLALKWEIVWVSVKGKWKIIRASVKGEWKIGCLHSLDAGGTVCTAQAHF